MTTPHLLRVRACMNGKAYNPAELLSHLKIGHLVLFTRLQWHLERRHRWRAHEVPAACFCWMWCLREGFCLSLMEMSRWLIALLHINSDLSDGGLMGQALMLHHTFKLFHELFVSYRGPRRKHFWCMLTNRFRQDFHFSILLCLIIKWAIQVWDGAR